MRGLSGFFKRVAGRGRRYDDLSVSIQEHLAERTQELMDEGMARERAERRARREFGNVELIAQRSREQWQWPELESLLIDIRHSLRRLRRTPVFTATVLLTLAIGIGANTAVFSVVNGVLLKPLPYPNSDRLVALWMHAPGAPGLSNFQSGLQLSASMYVTFAEQNRSFNSMGVWTAKTASVTGLAKPEEVQTALVSDGVLQTLAVAPALGRSLGNTDQDPHGAKTVMLSYGYWQRRFGGDAGAIGRSIQVDSQAREIVGVMPRGFRMVDRDFDLLVPLAFDRAHMGLGGFGFDGVARLKPGVTPAMANADVSRLIGVWMDSWTNGPGTNPHYYLLWKITPSVRMLKQQVIGDVGSVLWLVMATVGLVMLIASANVANLLLVRADARQQELAIRAALGAGRARIARELLLESFLLGLMGGVFALGVAYAGLRLLVAFGPADLPRLSEITLDGTSLGFTLAISVASSLFFGAIPAWKYARVRGSAANLSGARTASASREQHRSRNVLVVVQIAMALVLLVCALLMIRSFAALRGVEPGFTDAAHLQTMHIVIPEQMVADAHTVVRMQGEIADKLAEISGVDSVGVAAAMPMQGDDPNWDQIRVEGVTYQGGEAPLRLFNFVAPGYFKTAGTRLVAGRDFSWGDVNGMKPMVMVSENFARDSWGSAAAAVGKRVRQFSDTPWMEVIGVVEDVRHNGVDEEAPATVYWPSLYSNPYSHQHEAVARRSVTFAIRSARAGNEAFLSEVQRAVWSVNGNLPVASLQTMQEVYGASMARTSFTLVMLAIAGSMALLLGIIGIYGVISYGVAQRAREIGIRLALGAKRGELQWMFVRSALVLTSAGVAIGLVSAVGLMRTIRSMLFHVSPFDPVTYATVPVVLALAAALASYLPARRAAAVDPVEALRAE